MVIFCLLKGILQRGLNEISQESEHTLWFIVESKEKDKQQAIKAYQQIKSSLSKLSDKELTKITKAGGIRGEAAKDILQNRK